MAKRTVAVLGTGWVGASVAISTLHAGICDELLLHDARTDVADGEAMDLAHGAPFYPHATVTSAAIDQLTMADVIVVAAGRGGRPGESRLALLTDNVALIRTLAATLTGYRGVVIVVTNPVDVLTRELTVAAGLPAARVIGTGTMLDTARLRHAVGRTLSVDSRSVHALVVGEHGDSEVVLWSTARVGGVRLQDWPGWDPRQHDVLGEEVRLAAYEIIRRKGATNHAIGLVTADLLRCVLRDERRTLTVSRVQEGHCGIRDVALSLPAIVGKDGAATVIEPEMSDAERLALAHSAAVLHTAVDDIRNSDDAGMGAADQS
jgi:L-lactate dehydrogenase